MLRVQTTQLEAGILQRDEEIRVLNEAVENAELYSRRKDIKIHVVIQTDNKDLTEAVSGLARKLDLAVPRKECIEAVQSLSVKQGSKPPIIMSFHDRNVR